MKKQNQILSVEIPEGFYPKVFETLYQNKGGKMVQILYVYCEKSPKLKNMSATSNDNGVPNVTVSY